MIVGFDQYKHKYDFSGTNGVIHVGAHHGQEYDFYLETFGPEIATHWFEPIPSNFIGLEENLGKKPKCFLYKCALGPKDDELRFWIESDNSGESSSLLKPKAHLEIYPHIKFQEGEVVPVKPLDSFKISDSSVLVLDVQGFELEVLKGSESTLPLIKHVFCEVNSVEMYEGCPTMADLNIFLCSRGFWLRENYWTSGNWGDAYWSK